MSYHAASEQAESHGLMILGGFHPDADTYLPTGTRTLLLLGPAADFWPLFCTSPEAQDGAPDPIDRWSSRIIPALANTLNATPYLPFGGPPYAPFLSWALNSGHCWSSPLGMLVHDSSGLMVSFRGALAFNARLELPKPPTQAPCITCTPKPCVTACPVDALGPNGYDTDACHGYLNSPAGQVCLTKGCIARRACPVSPVRPNKQSAHHMSYFHR